LITAKPPPSFRIAAIAQARASLVMHAMKGVGNQHPIHVVRHQLFQVVCIAHRERAVRQAFSEGTLSRKRQRRGIEIDHGHVPDNPGERNCEEAVPAAKVNDLCRLFKAQPLQHLLRPMP
jgi:hypothetical protein